MEHAPLPGLLEMLKFLYDVPLVDEGAEIFGALFKDHDHLLQ